MMLGMAIPSLNEEDSLESIVQQPLAARLSLQRRRKS
jgi:hypothetical protein